MKVLVNGFLVLVLTGSLLASTVSAALAPNAIIGGSQTLNPAYLSEMPAPARVLKEIAGKDAEDTIERQMGAFKALEKMIDDLAWGIEHRYLPTAATPDENKIKYAYEVAYADLWHKATRNEEHLYDHDRTLVHEMMSKFFSQAFRDLLVKSDANTAANTKKFQEKISGVPTAPAKDDFDALCAAKGLDGFTCMMQGMMKMVTKAIDSGPVVPGLRMNGGYLNGNFSMRFDPAGSAWVNCGDVFLLSHYDVERKNDQIVVRIENDKDPFTLTLKPDGTTLAGPVSVPIHGHAPGGGSSTTTTTAGSTQQVQTTQQRTLTPLEAQQYPNAVQNGQTYTVDETTTSTQYTPGTTISNPAPWPSKTAPCKLGVLPVVIVQPSKAAEKPDPVAAMVNGIFPETGPVPNGVRMAGTYYGQGGSSVEFLPDKAILACHTTLAEHPYTVGYKAGQLLINLEGNGNAQAFTLKPDGTLAGNNAPIFINGRMKTGEDTLGDPTYTPSSDTCSYGLLSPNKAGQASTRSSANPVASIPSRQPETAKAPERAANTATGTGALSITGNFPGPSSNLFAGKPVLFLRSNAEEILRREGFVSQPGKSSLAAWAAACDAKDTANCTKGAQAIVKERVNAVGLTATGQAAFPSVPVGTYWVLADFRYNGKHYIWNMRIDVKPGSNAVSLDQNNTFVVF